MNFSLSPAKIAQNCVASSFIQKPSSIELALAKNERILDFSNQKVKPRDVVYLANVLKVNEHLQWIDLGGCEIGDHGAETLAGALKWNHSLQELYLEGNDIGNKGLGQLAGALKWNETLQLIYLDRNNISDRGLGILADALKVNTSLQTLYLDSNNIGKEGAQKIADALRVNQVLQEISLQGNKIDDEGASKLADALKVNQSLQHLELDDNKISSEMIHCIKQIVKDPARKEGKSNNLPSRSKFYWKLVHVLKNHQYLDIEIDDVLQELQSLIEDVYMMKFYYTAVSSMLRAGAMATEKASCLISTVLQDSIGLCVGAEEIADFKLILEKAESDGHIDRRTLFCLDNLAEVNVIKSDREFVGLMEAVKSNTARIEGLEANVQAINSSVNAIREGLKHKMKVEMVFGLLSTTINAISFGVGGSVLDATAAALGSIVDYGDIVHIESVAARYGDNCVDQVKEGIEAAVSRYADQKLEEAVMKGNILTVVAATAIMMDPSYLPQQSKEDSLKDAGDSAFQQGDYSEALKQYSDAITLNNDCFHLFSSRSMTYWKLGDLENALADASTAIKLNPLFPLGYYCKGKALHELKQFSLAATAFQNGLSISPEDRLLLEGWECLRMDEEFVTLQKESFYEQKSVSVDDKNFAEKDADTSIKLNPLSSKGCYLKGKELHETKHSDHEILAFEEGLSKCTENTELGERPKLTREDEPYLKSSLIKTDTCEGPLGNDLDVRSTHDEELPRTDISRERADVSNEEPVDNGTVDEWLLSWLPGLKGDDVSFYSKRLIQEGFDSVDALGILEEEDLDFMKKGHRRLLMRSMKEKQ